MRAGERKVFLNGRRAMLFGKDVVDLKRRGKSELRNQAVLTATGGTSPDPPEKVPSHTRLTPLVSLRNLRARDCITASRLPMSK
jgi:hypothetical protein